MKIAKSSRCLFATRARQYSAMGYGAYRCHCYKRLRNITIRIIIITQNNKMVMLLFPSLAWFDWPELIEKPEKLSSINQEFPSCLHLQVFSSNFVEISSIFFTVSLQLVHNQLTSLYNSDINKSLASWYCRQLSDLIELFKFTMPSTIHFCFPCNLSVKITAMKSQLIC